MKRATLAVCKTCRETQKRDAVCRSRPGGSLENKFTLTNFSGSGAPEGNKRLNGRFNATLTRTYGPVSRKSHRRARGSVCYSALGLAARETLSSSAGGGRKKEEKVAVHCALWMQCACVWRWSPGCCLLAVTQRSRGFNWSSGSR